MLQARFPRSDSLTALNTQILPGPVKTQVLVQWVRFGVWGSVWGTSSRTWCCWIRFTLQGVRFSKACGLERVHEKSSLSSCPSSHCPIFASTQLSKHSTSKWNHCIISHPFQDILGVKGALYWDIKLEPRCFSYKARYWGVFFTHKIYSLTFSSISKTVFLVSHLLLWVKEASWVICLMEMGQKAKKKKKTVQKVNKLFRIWCVFMSHGVGRGTELHQVGKPQTLWINSIQFTVLIMANTKVYQSGCEGVPSLFFLYDVWTWC